ncbi:hypothetical protein ACWNT8_11745 [Pigmentibacter ruber]|nr:hypothetical protein GTC16762_16440 [Pigmentibacter ruber]
MLKKTFNPAIVSCVVLTSLSINVYSITFSSRPNHVLENENTSDNRLVASVALLNYLGQKKIDNSKSVLNYINQNIEIELSDYRAQMANYEKVKNTADITYKILRSVMRNPSKELLISLQELHKNLRLFIPNDPITLNWILGGLKSNEKNYTNSRKDSSYFVARTPWKNIDDIINFLDADASQMPSSLLIVGLENLVCALAYRSINASWVEDPNPSLETVNSLTQIRANFIKELTQLNYQWLVPTIGTLFNRGIEQVFDTTTSLNPDSYFPSDYNENLSDVSDSEESSDDKNIKKKRLPKFNFYKTSQIDGVYGNTWTYSAHNAGLTVRANVSGSAPLALSIVVGFANSYQSPHLKFLLWNPTDFQIFKKNIQLLGTLLLVPNYERSDYHTVAETFVGITYYIYKLNEIRKDAVQKFPIDLAKIHPIDSYREALENLSEASSDEKYNVKIKGIGLEILSLKEAIKIISDDYLISKVDRNRIAFHTTGS